MNAWLTSSGAVDDRRFGREAGPVRSVAAPGNDVRGGEGAPSDPSSGVGEQRGVVTYITPPTPDSPAGLEPRADQNRVTVPTPEVIDPAPSSPVQLALARAHRAWAKRHAPHLLEEWLDA